MQSGKLSGVKEGGNNCKMCVHKQNEDHRAGYRKAKGRVSVGGYLPVRWFAVGSAQDKEAGCHLSGLL